VACLAIRELVFRSGVDVLADKHMIFKEKDSLDEQLGALEEAIQRAPTGQERQYLEKDAAIMRAGAKGEQEAAYHIDFRLKNSKNWAVVHDLRIELNGRVAQIDHLLINRLLCIYVVESKSFRTKIRHANGGWERLNFNHWEGIPCPVEQNQRHILVLEELIRETGMGPTRLGMAIRPKFVNVVVVHPACSIVGELPDDARIYRMDKLVSQLLAADPSPLEILKVVSAETVQLFAIDLLEHHKPAPQRKPISMSAPRAAEQPGPTSQPGRSKYDVPRAAEPPPKPTVTSLECQGCQGPLSTAEASYCRSNAGRFEGRLLCRKCQSQPAKPRTTPPVQPTHAEPLEEIAARCAVCGSGVDKKVVAFCRFSSKRFGGRVLCRTCQGAAAS